MPKTTITKIHITKAMTDLFLRLIVNSPWFRTKAHHCVISTDDTLEFDYERDSGKLLELVNAGRKFGFRAATVRAFKDRINAGTAHGHALAAQARRKAA